FRSSKENGGRSPAGGAAVRLTVPASTRRRKNGTPTSIGLKTARAFRSGGAESAHALPGLAGVCHRHGPGASERRTAPRDHGSERQGSAADPVMEPHLRELL